jgi:hypothetical protein
MKLLFLPFRITAGLAAGFLSKKLFDRAWSRVAGEEAPGSKHRDISPFRLAVALMLEGAVFRVARGMTDHAARRAFHTVTGRWPGEVAPEST